MSPTPVPEPLPRTAEEAAEDAYWHRLYGDWAPLDLPALRDLLAGFDRPWWVVGGWAIEAFTGVPREHEDLDLSVLACDVPALRAHLCDWHLWSISDQALRPLTDRHPGPPAPDDQLWLRRDARSPWVADLPLTPDHEGLWTNKRLPAHVAPVEEVTFVRDGVRHLRPEIVLLFKARLHRAKDERDLAVTWPLLDDERRAWLLDALARVHPDHPWLERLSG